MSYYRCTGSILIEGTLEQADYDFEVDPEDIADACNPMDILNYMLQTGIIQILHEDTDYYPDDEDEDE
jgi:hypothetical protein